MRNALLAVAALLAAPYTTDAQSQTTGSETREQCEARWLAAERAGIVYGVGMVDGRPTAMVDEDAFMTVDYTVKLGFAATLNCAVAGPGAALAEIVFVSHRTGKRLARWTPAGGLVVD